MTQNLFVINGEIILQERKKYIDELSSQLKKWDDDLQKLENKMYGTKGDLKKKIHCKIEELRKLKESANQRVIEIHHSGENTREGIKS